MVKRLKLSEKVLRDAEPLEGNSHQIFDTEIIGLAAKVQSSGTRAFTLDYRFAGRQRRMSIGRWPDWSVTAARERAKELRRMIDEGHDPLAAKEDLRVAPRISDMIDRYIREHLPKLSPTNAGDQVSMLKKMLAPAWGNRLVTDITKSDVAKFLDFVAEGRPRPCKQKPNNRARKLQGHKPTPIRANRMGEVLRKMFTLAVEWEWRADNPAQGFHRRLENARERFLSPEELVRLAAALDAAADQRAASIIRMCMLTGVDIGGRAAEGFARGFERDLLSAPDLGLGDTGREALANANTYRQAAQDLATGATLPLASWQALRDAVSGSEEDGTAALSAATASAEVFNAALGETEESATRAGAAARQAGTDAKDGADVAATGWRAVSEGLAGYADDAMNWGKGISDTLVGAFRSAEGAFRDFVKTGKVDFKGLVASILTDLAVLQFRKAVLGPIANALSGAFGGFGGFGGGSAGGNAVVSASVLHAGGMVGALAPMRAVPALAFAGAPRMHRGGMVGLRPDEVPAILQRGERVLSRRETAQYGAGAGGISRVRIELGEGLVGRIMEQAGTQSVEIVQGSLREYDRLVAPRTVARVSQDPRRSG